MNIIKAFFLTIQFMIIFVSCGQNPSTKSNTFIHKKTTFTKANEPPIKQPETEVKKETTPIPTSTIVKAIECGTNLECELIEKTNQIRLKNSLSNLGIFAPCVLMAQDHAQYLASGGVFSHDRPDETFEDRAKRFGCLGGENIAYGTTTVDETLALWMNSTGHRENILYASFKSMGAGHQNNYWVQCFSYENGNLELEKKK